MNFNWLLDLVLNQIFGQPFILIGIIVLIGYLAMNQKFSKALTGALKAAIGVIRGFDCEFQ